MLHLLVLDMADWVGHDFFVVYCRVLVLVHLGDECAGVRLDAPLHPHVVPLDHVQPQRLHFHALVRRVLALHRVAEDDVAEPIRALELADDDAPVVQDDLDEVCC